MQKTDKEFSDSGKSQMWINYILKSTWEEANIADYTFSSSRNLSKSETGIDGMNRGSSYMSILIISMKR